MKQVSNKLQVWHYAQFPCEPFKVDVKNEEEAYSVFNILANQHLFLLKHQIIPDYSNVLCVMMEDNGEWVDYWNDDEVMNWEELEEEYFSTDLQNSGES